MNIAITHKVSPRIVDCELTFLERQVIDFNVASMQHSGYNSCLKRHGLTVIELDVNIDLPDSVFVEDTAIVVDELAVMTTMGVDSRRPEVPGIEQELKKHRPIAHIAPEANIEGGDVSRVGKTFYVGLSSRTDKAGVESLASHLEPLGYTVIGVPMKKALHLKSGISALDENTLIINREFVSDEMFKQFKLIDVPVDEPKSGNVLRLPDGVVIMPAEHVQMAEKLTKLGYEVDAIEMSELLKAESGVTCSSLIFKDMSA